jgi:lipopolysaccharide/colanic/teichoic acid biosynthesis glycosyltransferase
MNDPVIPTKVYKYDQTLHPPNTPVLQNRPPEEAGWWVADDPTRKFIRLETYLILKRIFDILAAIIAIPILSPVLIVCAVLIKFTSPGGPTLFLQERTGKGGKRFTMFKFRTMVPNAEKLKGELSDLNEFSWPDFKVTDDPRITKIGKFLRKTSLDELPQVFNVLIGDMSMVGPRPTSFTPETYQLWHTERLDVLPGITGLWQIIGRGTLDFDQRVRLDVAYIQHRSLLLDFKIFFKTVLAVIERRGAH